ncbi:MAG TPA: sigma-70 family RNA polymerase sigma factor [Phycisphaerales bacterium]|nr:sigma-70 family RNA polymerase sigma factor [Phycisphaerales bacterium]
MKHSEQVELFNRIRARYAMFLTSVLWKLAGDRELFTEAMQYTLFEMWQRIDKLRGDNAGAYLYRIALSANSKAWRNRVGKNGRINADLLCPAPGQDEALARREMARIVRRAVAELPAQQSQAIVMRYLEQHDYDAIAEKLNCTQASARSHVSKAMATLKGRLAKLTERE